MASDQLQDAKIQLALEELKEAVRAFRILGLERIEHAENRINNTFTFYFENGQEPITLTDDEWLSPQSTVKAFLRYSVALPVKTDWELVRTLAMSGSVHIRMSDAWASMLEEYVNIRASYRDYEIDPTAIQLLVRGTATSIGYGETKRLISLYQMTKWATKEKRKLHTPEQLWTRLGSYCEKIVGLPMHVVAVRMPIDAKD